MDQSTIGFYVLTGLLVLLAIGVIALYIVITLWSPPPIVTYPSEKSYLSSASPSKPLPLPTLKDDRPTTASVDLSVIVPAFNEKDRLPKMLEATIAYLEKVWVFGDDETGVVLPDGNAGVNASALQSKNNVKQRKVSGQKRSLSSSSGSTRSSIARSSSRTRTFEIIIVDDGSSDSTSQIALDLAKSKYPKTDIKVVTLSRNRGKGGAVRHGMLHASGRRLLMADADGATRIEDLEKLWTSMDNMLANAQNDEAVVVGSRAHLVKTEAVVKRSLLRNILMYGFHTILRVLGVGHIRDTQCGFKLFSRAGARVIFPNQRLSSWVFDVELLLIAKQLGIAVEEVDVEWQEVEGSKLNVVSASIGMLRDLVIIRTSYGIGRWKIKRSA